LVFLDNLFSLQDLRDNISEGYVSAQRHPKFDLMIYNYTHKAQYDQTWNDVTRQCRGLIIDIDTLRVIARPFPKFFNVGEEQAPKFRIDTPVVATDKLDGSLGILYDYPVMGGKKGIATRGSFTSEQAVRGTQILQRYSDWMPAVGCTYLFEIIYPENRIVCDYKGVNDIFLLDVLETDTGQRAVNFAWTFPGPWVDELPYETYREAVEAPPREGREGMVIFLPHLNERVKLKQDDYVALHRILTGLNAKRVWEAMVEGVKIEDFIEPIPDEFHGWVRETWEGIDDMVEQIAFAVWKDFMTILRDLEESHPNQDWTRKDFALEAKRYPEPSLLFMLLDEREIHSVILKGIQPPATIGPTSDLE